jgi:hypothetical protein
MSWWIAGMTLTVAMTASLAAGAAQVELVRDGQATARIYVPGPLLDDAALTSSEAVRRPAQVDADAKARTLAVRELNEHLQLMSGASLEVIITDDAASIRPPAIVLGKLAQTLAEPTSLRGESREGYRLRVADGVVAIAGQSDAGVLFGVYDLLTRLGCEWVMPGEIGRIVPRQATVRVAPLDVQSEPAFQVRRLWYRGYPDRKDDDFARFSQWMRRQRAGQYVPPVLFGRGGHVWDQLIKRHKEEFERDPTMLALVRLPDGTTVRKGPQIESTHPRVIELIAQEIEEEYRKNIESGRWTAQTAAGFPIGPADGLSYSMSPESLAAGSGRVDPIGELDRTDEVVLLANRVLERLRPKHPNAMVSFYLYSVHGDYPLRYVPDRNLAIIFAPINFSRFHSIIDPNARTQAYNRRVTEQWGELSQKQGNPLIFRGYNWNLAENLLPYSKVRIWGEELPWYHRMGVIALNVEATKQWSVLAPSDYVFMKLAWDPSQDWATLLGQFCAKAFGRAAELMEKHFLDIIDRQHDGGHEAGSYHAYHMIYDLAWVEQARGRLAQARALAADDGQRERVDMFAHNVEALSLYLQYHAATLRFDFAAAKSLYDQMHEHWRAGYDRNPDWVCNSGPAYLKRFVSGFVDQAAALSGGANRMVQPLPDELPTMFDPHRHGVQMRLFDPAISDSAWLRTRTISTTWDAQGLGALRSGSVWYRHHFTLDAATRGQPLGLFLGSVDDEARVWLNGQLIGTSGRGFSKPGVFDLTPAVQGEGPNVLAIEVFRNSVANELGTGGIFRPSFLFTGPSITPTQPPVRQQRVLPGGEVAPES